jgi:antitoxin HicB
MKKLPAFERYPFNVEPLAADEGGGYVITFPDLPGCMSDGNTVGEAIAQGREAFLAWMESIIADGKSIPEPHRVVEPAKFLLRLPRTLHGRLASRASAEGVSLNSLVQTYVAEGLGRH